MLFIFLLLFVTYEEMNIICEILTVGASLHISQNVIYDPHIRLEVPWPILAQIAPLTFSNQDILSYQLTQSVMCVREKCNLGIQ